MKHRKNVSRLGLTVLAVLISLAAVTGIVLAANNKPDFAMGMSPASVAIQRGQTAGYTVTATGSGGFSSQVALSVSGLPSGATATFTSASVSPTAAAPAASSTLNLVTTASTPVGTSTITITGTSGSTKRTVTASLTVSAPATNSFGLSASPSLVSVAPGSVAVYTVTVNRSGSFAGPVSLAVNGSLPSGASAAFSPNPVPSNSTSATLQLSTAATTPDGTYPLSIVGSNRDPSTGQTATQNAAIELVVDSNLSSKPFSISGGSPAKALAPGVADQPLNLALNNPNNQVLPVTNLSVTVSGTSKPACSASNFVVTQYSGPYPLNVPANANGVTLSALGVGPDQQPKLRMLDLPSNQDQCKGVVVNLAYSGSAGRF